MPPGDELCPALRRYATRGEPLAARRVAAEKVAKRRAPKTHLSAEIAARRRDPRPSEKPRTQRALAALAVGDAAAIEAMLAEEVEVVEETWQDKYRNDAQTYWDQFYIEKNVNFFKDRNYLREEFGELMPAEVLADPKAWVERLSASAVASAGKPQATESVLLEVGCAVGNGVLPMLRANPRLYAYACDLSPVAVGLLKGKEEYAASGRCHAFPCDIARDEQPTPEHQRLEDVVPAGCVDFCSMLFILSAIGPERHEFVLRRLHAALRPGGCVLFRDYGRHDLSQLRFEAGHRLGEDTYVRADGTLAVFFDVERLSALFEAVGFQRLECGYIRKEIVNRAKDLTMPRIWVQGKFRRI